MKTPNCYIFQYKKHLPDKLKIRNSNIRHVQHDRLPTKILVIQNERYEKSQEIRKLFPIPNYECRIFGKHIMSPNGCLAPYSICLYAWPKFIFNSKITQLLTTLFSTPIFTSLPINRRVLSQHLMISVSRNPSIINEEK